MAKKATRAVSFEFDAMQDPAPSAPQHTPKPAPAFKAPVRGDSKKPIAVTPFPLSPQQLDVLDWVRNGTGNAFVQARAGSGKTATLTVVCREMFGSVAYAAFNKKIAEEVKYKLGDLPGVRVGTFHSFGFGGWRRVAPRVTVNAQQKDRAMMDHVGVPSPLRSAVRRMVSLGKQSVVGLAWQPDNVDFWVSMIDHHNVLLAAPATKDEDRLIKDLIEYSVAGLQFARDQGTALIDFDDMLWLPLIEDVSMYQNDWVLVDEAQDTNVARRLLAERMVKRNGRTLWVGDTYQSIYGFCHPPGTVVETPNGPRAVESLRRGDPVLVASPHGEIEGWTGRRTVKATHVYDHVGRLLTIRVGEHRTVEMTPHHRIPVRLSPDANYYTYMMRRCGVYRVGFCRAFTTKQFMLQVRRKLEQADAVWLLAAHATLDDAKRAERQLLRRVKGTTFSKLKDEQVLALPTDETNALALLAEYGRMVDFPFLSDTAWDRRISRSGAFIMEACNVLDGMLGTFLDHTRFDARRRGRNRSKFSWEPITVTQRQYTGKVYGITVDPALATQRAGYRTVPLYFGGSGQVLVHNTGADADAVSQIIEHFNCAELPLTVSFRCSKAATALAQRFVPDIRAAESNLPGSVTALSANQMDQWLRDKQFRAGDAILCRNTRPLVDLAFQIIRSGVGCHVEGRDIGMQLGALATRWEVPKVTQMLTKLAEYRVKETTRLIARDAEHLIEPLNDRVETLMILADGCDTVTELCDKIEGLFRDTEAGESKRLITLSTVHKAKGREWDRVFLLGWGKYMPSKMAKKDWEFEQERNLQYVAVTRTKDALYLTEALS